MDNFGKFLYDKCITFSVRIIKLTQYLQSVKYEYVVSKQICKSGTSIGANLAEAQYGSSKKDFLSKCYISLRESSETCYWLEVLYKAKFITEKQYLSLNDDCVELKKLFVSITNSTKNSLNGKPSNGVSPTPNS